MGRHDFVAVDDQEAVAMANFLCDACSDHCDSFEVWDGDHRIGAARTPHSLSQIDGLLERRQAAVIEHEETIQRSEWTLAGSKRLLERLNELRA